MPQLKDSNSKDSASKAKTAMIKFNCCPDVKEPDWGVYDALEVQYVAQHKDGDDQFCEPTDNVETAHFVSLYAHLNSGGVECIHDFPDGFFDTGAIECECLKLAERLGFKLHSFL